MNLSRKSPVLPDYKQQQQQQPLSITAANMHPASEGVSDGIPAKAVKPLKLPPQRKYVFQNANVVDPVCGAVIPNQTVKLSGGLIESVGDAPTLTSSDAVIVDLAGKYLCPGLIDCHVHVSSLAGETSVSAGLDSPDVTASYLRQPFLLKQRLARGFNAVRDTGSPFLLKQMLSRGFTTVRDAGGATLALKKAVDDDVLSGPRIFRADRALARHGDIREPHDKEIRCGCDWTITGFAKGVPPCRLATGHQIRAGADYLEIVVDGDVTSPTDKPENDQFTSAEIQAIVKVANNAGTYVTAHAHTPQAIRHAIDNGVLGIEHGNFIDEETAARMADKGVWLTPTLVAFDAMGSDKYVGFLPPVDRQKNSEVLANGLDSLRIAEAAGVTMCYGSDLPGLLQEEQSREFAIRSQVLSSQSILRAATVNPARLLGQEKSLGQIQCGFSADLIVLKGNPLDDITILAEPEKNVLAVLKNGRVYTSRWSGLPEGVTEVEAKVA